MLPRQRLGLVFVLAAIADGGSVTQAFVNVAMATNERIMYEKVTIMLTPTERSLVM